MGRLFLPDQRHPHPLAPPRLRSPILPGAPRRAIFQQRDHDGTLPALFAPELHHKVSDRQFRPDRWQPSGSAAASRIGRTDNAHPGCRLRAEQARMRGLYSALFSLARSLSKLPNVE
jgi:hypothetical protein